MLRQFWIFALLLISLGPLDPAVAEPRCLSFLKKIEPVINKSVFRWDSKVLRNEIIRTPADGRRIVDLVFQSKDLQEELRALIDEYKTSQSAELWNVYFESYDKAVAFSDGYLQIIDLAADHLPQKGKIIEYGLGTGNVSSGLAHLSPERKLVGFDISAIGVETSRRKLRQIYKSEADFSVYESDLLKTAAADPATQDSDGAVMNNVLYTVSTRQERLEVLQRIYRDLKPGGTFVLNDPKRELQGSDASTQEFLTKIMEDAIKNGSKISAHEIAILTMMNKASLIRGDHSNPFMSREELRALAQEAGFELTHEESTYYDKGNLLVLKKPK